MKNAYRITERMNRTETMPSQYGVVTCEKWCELDAARITAKGATAIPVLAGDKCWLSRPREGCAIMRDDEASE